jgi:molybdopterin synthase catalytic subunit
MTLDVFLFAGLAERIGSSSVRLELGESSATLTAAELKRELIRRFPDSEALIRASFVAKNQAYAEDSENIGEQDEVALIPPVSGGEELPAADSENPNEPMYCITPDPLSVETVARKVIRPNHGAVLTFAGTTRQMTGDKRTILLEYEAYVPMALKTMEQIGNEIGKRWPGTVCAISHRIGRVDIAEISVVIAVSSPHREECYEASRYAIERLKQIVPVWKKEYWADGTEWIGHQTGPWNPTAAPRS